MKESKVSIAEGKRDFSRIIQDSQENEKEIIITKRGKPVAVILPYEKFQKTKRMEGYKKIMEAREAFLKAELDAEEVFKESKKQREKKPWTE
jgi:prevent-host-death family protein